MIIYNLLVHELETHAQRGKEVSDANYPDSVKVKKKEPNNRPLLVEKDYMLTEYNIRLTDEAVEVFETHRRAWELFEKSGDKSCLIVENNAITTVSHSDCVKHVEELPIGWDLFFPFDKSAQDNNLFEMPSVLGYYWGSFAYFISRDGVKKLLEIAAIRQDVDEEILELSKQGKIQTYTASGSFFAEDVTQSEPIYKTKQKAVRDAIFCTNVWNATQKEKARLLIGWLYSIASQLDIHLVLDSGTLLGHVRHGEIIPWDDDMDLAINQTDLPRLLDSLKTIEELRFDGFVLHDSGCTYHKIWLQSGEYIERNRHLYPFVDLWQYYIVEDEVVFEDGRRFSQSAFYPLQKVEFEGIQCYTPNRAQACLDAQYPGWDQQIIIFPWSHQQEKPGGYVPLRTKISVDKNGRILSEV